MRRARTLTVGRAVTARHACDAYLQRNYPCRHSLRNQLRYLLTHLEGLAEWAGEDGTRLAGFSVWRERQRCKPNERPLRQLLDDPRGFAQSLPRGEDLQEMFLGDLIAALFNWVGSPIELDALVRVVAELHGVEERVQVAPPAEEEAAGAHSLEQIVDRSAGILDLVERRESLRQLWSEIHQLPPNQCAALLLNLTDARGHGIVALLPLLGIASQDEIAQALCRVDACGKATAEFEALWERLPIEDTEIARILGGTRQQVINLRKAGRERLARRIRDWILNRARSIEVVICCLR